MRREIEKAAIFLKEKENIELPSRSTIKVHSSRDQRGKGKAHKKH